MSFAVDVRDRTAEFLSTLAQIQKAQRAALLANGSGGSSNDSADVGRFDDGFSHRPLPKSTSASSGFHSSEFDSLPSSSSFSSSSFSSAADPVSSLLGSSLPSTGLINGVPPHQQTRFTLAARHIGSGLSNVTSKLDRLGKLARHRGLFNDPTAEINTLTTTIKADLETLHRELEQLHTFVETQREAAFARPAGSDASGSSSSSSSDSSADSVHASRHSSAIIEQLKRGLMSTTKNFQDVLMQRTKSLKEQHARRKVFETAPTSATTAAASDDFMHSPSAATVAGNAAVRKRAGNAFDALLDQAAVVKPRNNSSFSSSSSSSAFPSASFDTEPATDDDLSLSLTTPGAAGFGGTEQSQLLAAPQQDQSNDYLTSRAEAVEQIESTIVELGEMYKRLVHIVGMQEEITLRIDANMDSALDNIDRGHGELLKYYDSISGSRWLILKIFAVLLAFLIFFMIFVA